MKKIWFAALTLLTWYFAAMFRADMLMISAVLQLLTLLSMPVCVRYLKRNMKIQSDSTPKCRVYANGKSEEQIAAERLSSMESWMRELGLAMYLRELGATEEILEGIADRTVIMDGGYKVLNRDEVLEILKASL